LTRRDPTPPPAAPASALAARVRSDFPLSQHVQYRPLDATDIDRIADTIDRYGERFTRRIFTEREVAYCTRRRVPAIHFAGRFAAKEAAMKALGTGHSQGVLWRDVEVLRGGGPPQLQFHGGAARRFAAWKSSLLTITHSDTLALAQVLILAQ
jgi:holo-[acyl-carrier protein] synthase